MEEDEQLLKNRSFSEEAKLMGRNSGGQEINDFIMDNTLQAF